MLPGPPPQVPAIPNQPSTLSLRLWLPTHYGMVARRVSVPLEGASVTADVTLLTRQGLQFADACQHRRSGATGHRVAAELRRQIVRTLAPHGLELTDEALDHLATSAVQLFASTAPLSSPN